MRPAPLAKSQNAPLIDETMSMMDELSLLLAQEIECVAKQNFEGIKRIMPVKGKLVIDYQSRLKLLASSPEVLRNVSPQTRKKLKESGEQLAELTKRNALALRTAAECSQRLINYVMDHVRKETLPTNGYQDPRAARFALGTYTPNCPSVAVKRTA